MKLDLVATGSAEQAAAGSSEGFGGDGPSSVSGLWRWVIGSVLVVPALLAAGVYWLHQMPAGPALSGGDAVIHVELIPTPGPVAEVRQAAVQTEPPIAQFDAPPTIAEPMQPAFEQPATPTLPTPVARPVSLPAQPPGGALPARTASGSVSLKFQRQLLSHIERFQRYPGAARRDGLQGTALIVFAMRRDGSVVEVGIKSSSGAMLLDREAMETIRRAQPLPPIPAGMPDQVTVMIPVAFDMR